MKPPSTGPYLQGNMGMDCVHLQPALHTITMCCGAAYRSNNKLKVGPSLRFVPPCTHTFSSYVMVWVFDAVFHAWLWICIC